MSYSRYLLATAFAAGFSALACQSEEVELCEGGLCDDPGSAAGAKCRTECGTGEIDACFWDCRRKLATGHCEARRQDAIESSSKAFTKDAIRWACSDVDGVNNGDGNDNRGQEYCEYFAIVAPPPARAGGSAPLTVGKLNRGGQAVGSAVLKLNQDQSDALEDAGDAVVGQCIFTSWHSDIAAELTACTKPSCPEISLPDNAKLPPWRTARGLGHEMTGDLLRMVNPINSNFDAAGLAEMCLVGAGFNSANDATAGLTDDYRRGCMSTFDLFRTEWRRSDPTICTATMRAAECGCGVDTNGDGVADIVDARGIAGALVPPQKGLPQISLRGFPLGTWSDAEKLPAGCRYLEIGQDRDAEGKPHDSHTIVACNLTAADVIGSEGSVLDGADVKNMCRTKYGDNVVVHIPIPVDAIVCKPPAGARGATCGELVPWTKTND